MTSEIFNKPRLEKIQYKDLTVLSRWEVLREVLLSLPWLLLYVALAYYEYFIPALLCSFWFFLTGLRQAHNAYHYTLGLSRKGTEYMLFILSIVMIIPLHSVKYNHLQHHKHCLSERDVEGKSARMSWWKAILYGPLFPVELTLHALKNGKRSIKHWIWAELVFIVLVYMLLLTFCYHRIFLFHVITMLIGECLTAFFAVWTVHHDCDVHGVHSRTIRGRWKPRIFYGLFYHTEHHLYPQVPTCKLNKLASRVDKEFPEVRTKMVM